MKIGIIVYSQTGNTLSVAEKLKEKLAVAGHSAEIEQVMVGASRETGPSNSKPGPTWRSTTRWSLARRSKPSLCRRCWQHTCGGSARSMVRGLPASSPSSSLTHGWAGIVPSVRCASSANRKGRPLADLLSSTGAGSAARRQLPLLSIVSLKHSPDADVPYAGGVRHG